MKVAVYTICKNEKHNVADWIASCAEADYIVVADTGSDDGTEQALRRIRNEFASVRGAPKVFVHKISIVPWRFDDARNAVLALVPADADVCIPMDLDERFSPGWRKALEAGWTPEATACFYTYVFAHNADGTPSLQFLNNRIHARQGYRWKYPDHEGVYPYGHVGNTVQIPDLKIEQWQDRTKDRSGILMRLAMGVAEFPNDARTAHYYGRELMYYGQYRAALEHLERYTRLPGGFPVEQAANADCIATCYRMIAEGKC